MNVIIKIYLKKMKVKTEIYKSENESEFKNLSTVKMKIKDLTN